MEVAAAPGRESGAVAVHWAPAAADDPLVGGLAAEGSTPFPTMHADAVVELPDGAVPLARSDLYPHQAFRLGSAWGVQFHPETSVETFTRWAAQEPDVDGPAVVEDYRRHEADIARAGRALAAAFAGLVEQRAIARTAVPG